MSANAKILILKVVLVMYQCQFGLNLAVGSEDRVQTRLFIVFKTLMTMKIRYNS